MIRAHEDADDVRHDKADKANDAARRDHYTSHERYYYDGCLLNAPDIYTQADGRFVPLRKQVICLRHEHEE